MLALWTDQADGDQRSLGLGRIPEAPVPADRLVRRLRQVHGARVVVVGDSGPDDSGPGDLPNDTIPVGDALVAAGDRYALAVLTADCAPVALGSPEGLYAAVHVGWRGLAAGVVGRAVDRMCDLGAGAIVAGLGPCIGPCCYEFSPSLAASLSQKMGEPILARTRRGRPSLDLPAAVRLSLRVAGVPVAVDVDRCTACTPGYFSHRARRDEARQALLVWREG